MERRLLYAIALMIVVAVVPTLIWKPAPRARTPAAAVDSARASAPDRGADTVAAAAQPRRPALAAAAPIAAAATTTGAAIHYDTLPLERTRTKLTFTTAGASIAHAVYPEYRAFRGPGRADRQPVDLVRPGDRLLVTRLVFEGDTIPFDSVAFTATPHTSGISFTGA